MPETPSIPEGGLTGEAPEETPAEAPEVPETPEATPPTQARERRGWRRYVPWMGGRKENPEPEAPEAAAAEEAMSSHQEVLTTQEATVREAEKTAGQIASPERMEKLARSKNPEDLVKLFENMNFLQFREMQLNEKHGRGVAGLYRRFKAGDFNFEVTKEGQMRRRIWMELAHKGAKAVFNRKTGIAVGTAAIASVLSAGTAAPAVWGIVGSVVGRAGVEEIESAYGDIAGRRQRILEADQSRFEYMQQLAKEISTGNLSPEEKQAKIEELVAARFRPSQEIACEGHPSAEHWQQQMTAEARLAQSEKIWERRGDIGALVGGATAMAASFIRGLQGLADLGKFDLDGDKIKHVVRIVGEKMQYAIRWENGEAISRAAVQQGSRFFHEIGPTASSVIPKVAAQIGVVFGNLAYWALRRRPDITTNVPEMEEQEEQEDKNEILRKAGEMTQKETEAAAAQEAAAQAAQQAAQATLEKPAAKQRMAQEFGEGSEAKIPSEGELWIYRDVGGLAILKIKSINWEAEPPMATVERFDYAEEKIGQDLKSLGEVQYSLEEIALHGSRQEAFIQHWAEPVNEGDDLEIAEGVAIVDQNDPRKKAVIPAGNYRISGLGEKTGGEANLVGKDGILKGKRLRANLFDLAFAGARSGEPGKEVKTTDERHLVKNTIWQIKENLVAADNPGGLKDVEFFRIIELDGNNVRGYAIDAAGKAIGSRTLTVPKDGFLTYFEYGKELGGAGGEGGGGQGRSRGQRNQ